MTARTAPEVHARTGTGREGLVLAIVLLGTFTAILDVAVVNLAILAIRSDLHTSYGGVELVISAYTITYAALLVTGGRLGDLYGRKRLFVTGLLAFSVASALCGAAPDVAVLVTARAPMSSRPRSTRSDAVSATVYSANASTLPCCACSASPGPAIHDCCRRSPAW